MYRTIADFEHDWTEESEATLKVLRKLTDASLGQAVTPGRRTLGRLAWHVVGSVYEMMGTAGLTVDGPAVDGPVPPAAELVRLYEEAAPAVTRAVRRHWDDGMLPGTISMYGEQWTRGRTLSALIAHQTHHRGQMTVLMRQAGLPVPGVYGPSFEEWSAMGMPPQD